MKSKINKGFSVVEVVVAASIFAIVSMAIYQGFISITNLISASRDKVTIVDLINGEFELIRNLPYASVGLQAGIPSGVLLANTTVLKDGKSFTINRAIRNIDDPFDGTIGGTPNDLSAADYKMAQIDISCDNCKNPLQISGVSNISPKNLETASTNGALFIKVFDANGNPLSGASVHLTNATLGIDITDVTNNDGLLAIVDVPPADNAYRIVVTKAGFTTDRTYPISVSNPHPVKPDATVLLQQLTQVSFVIDKVSTINVHSKNLQCADVVSVPFTIKGAKLIGTDPDILKFDESYTTDSFGAKILNNIEWDSFNMTIGGGFNLVGINPASPFSVLPDSIQNVDIIIADGVSNNLLVTVKDSVTNLPLSGVTLTLDQGSNEMIKVTGRGYLEQTDWSGGDGQTNFSDETKYFSSDGNIDTSSPDGTLQLKKSLGSYVASGVLTSSVFDTGTQSNFNNIIWSPTDQPPQTGVGSVKFQFASSTDNETETVWTYLGPDGTTGTYYTLSNNNIDPGSNGNRYFRYKIFLHTNANNKTPNISSIAVTYTSDCIPPGQALFSGLSSGNHDLLLEKSGYQTKVFESNIITNLDWQSINATMSPQ